MKFLYHNEKKLHEWQALHRIPTCAASHAMRNLDSMIFRASKCHSVPVLWSQQKDNKCSINAEQMTCERTLRRCSALPPVFWVAASQLWLRRFSGGWCLLTKRPWCAAHRVSTFPKIHGSERWIAAARPFTSRRRKEETNSWINGVCLILLPCLPPVSASFFVGTSLSFSADGVFGVKLKVSGQTAEPLHTSDKYKRFCWVIFEISCTYCNTKEGLVLLEAAATINIFKKSV